MNESNEQRVIRIMESFEASLKPLGIEVCGKDLFEILSEMANVIAELKNEVFDLQQEMHNVTRGYTYSPSENRDE